MRKINIRNISFNVINKHENFWNIFESETWEKTTFDIFDLFINNETCFFDIGSWMGPTALYAAHTAKRVICIEADPVAFEELRQNVELNPAIRQKILLVNKAISNHEDKIKMGAHTSKGDSMSSILFANSENYWEIETITPAQLKHIENNIYKNYFTKIDIEGGEYSLMPNLQELINLKKNTFFISLHPKFIEKNSVVRFFKTAYLTGKALSPFKNYNIALVQNKEIKKNKLINMLVKYSICFLPIKSGILLYKED